MMNVPSGLKKNDKTRTQAITILNHTDSSLSVAKKDKEFSSVVTPDPEAITHLNWENRMTLWKEKLQASGTIKSFEEL